VTWSKVSEIEIMNLFDFCSSIAWETDSHPCQCLFLFRRWVCSIGSQSLFLYHLSNTFWISKGVPFLLCFNFTYYF